MSGPMQFIRLSTGTREEGGTLIQNLQLAYDAEWPPPEILWVVTPHGTPERRALWTNLEPADELAGYMGDMDVRYTATPFKQISCSKLDAETVTDGFVARGAEYIPMGKGDQ